jgi:hypothetical protein
VDLWRGTPVLQTYFPWSQGACGVQHEFRNFILQQADVDEEFRRAEERSAGVRFVTKTARRVTRGAPATANVAPAVVSEDESARQ